MELTKADKKRRLIGIITSSAISAISIGVVNYIAFFIKNTRTNQLMMCGLIGFLADILIVQVAKAAISFAILIYIGRSSEAGGKRRKLLLWLLPLSLLEKLR